LPVQESPAINGNTRGSQPFDLARWIAEHGIEVARNLAWAGGERWILERWVFDPAHGGTSVAILRLANGAISYCCLHNGCASRKWSNVRELFEPGYRERRADFKPPSGNPDVERLAALPALKYDAIRKQEAKRLGVRLDTLDDEVAKARKQHQEKHPEPKPVPQWAPRSRVHCEAVNGAELIAELIVRSGSS
jgi:hypothetical protein